MRYFLKKKIWNLYQKILIAFVKKFLINMLFTKKYISVEIIKHS